MADNAYLLGPNGSVSIADMYKGIYDPAPSVSKPKASSEGLNVRTVKTVPIQIDGLTTLPVMPTQTAGITSSQQQAIRDVSKLSPHTYDPGSRSADASTVNTRLPSEAPVKYPFGYRPENQNSALSAIDNATRNSLLSQGINGHNRAMTTISSMFAGPSSNGIAGADLGGADPWGDKLRGPNGKATTQAPGYAYGSAPRAAAPAATKPVGLLETIASMFSPSAAPAAPTYTTTPFQESAFQTTTGAQMPSSMNNSRWTTGYA